jgi:hypothetical protein
MASSDAANAYFRRPYEVFKKGEAIDKEVVVNPETLLLNVYTAANVNVFGSKHIDDVYRIFRSPEREPKYYEDDLKKPRCPQTKEYETAFTPLFGLVF